MPEIAIFTACEKAVVDRFTNELSLHTVMDQVQPLRSGTNEDVTIAKYYLAPFYSVTVWRCLSEEIGKSFEQKVKMITPDSKDLELVAPIKFQIKEQRHRIVQVTPPISARLTGEYTLELWYRNVDNNEEWRKKCEYSFILRGDLSVYIPPSMVSSD